MKFGKYKNILELTGVRRVQYLPTYLGRYHHYNYHMETRNLWFDLMLFYCPAVDEL